MGGMIHLFFLPLFVCFLNFAAAESAFEFGHDRYIFFQPPREQQPLWWLHPITSSSNKSDLKALELPAAVNHTTYQSIYDFEAAAATKSYCVTQRQTLKQAVGIRNRSTLTHTHPNMSQLPSLKWTIGNACLLRSFFKIFDSLESVSRGNSCSAPAEEQQSLRLDWTDSPASGGLQPIHINVYTKSSINNNNNTRNSNFPLHVWQDIECLPPHPWLLLLL